MFSIFTLTEEQIMLIGQVSIYLEKLLQIILSLWWLWLTLFIYAVAKYLWIWGSRDVKFYSPIDWVLLEMKIPEEVEKTPKAMENVFHVLWGIYDPPANVRDYWMDGKWIYRYSFEMRGEGEGKVHFYIRCPRTAEEGVKSALYGEYPEIEIKEVEDYVMNLGEIPNEDYDLWGCDLMLFKPDAYPLRTYTYWETELTRFERRIDPLAALFEVLGSLKKGEEIWIQILAGPITDDEHPWKKDVEKLVAKIMKRPPEEKAGIKELLAPGRIPSDIWTALVEGKPIPPPIEEKVPEKAIELGLMRLSPGEAEVLRSLEENAGKYMYETNVRFIYVAKRDLFSPPGRRIGPIMGALNQFSTENLNGWKPDKTKTKVVPWFFEERRLYLRKRKFFRHYSKRFWPWHRKPYVFSTAELATIYHFPSKAVAPSAAVPRVEIKRAGPPPTLPI